MQSPMNVLPMAALSASQMVLVYVSRGPMDGPGQHQQTLPNLGLSVKPRL